MLPAARVTDMHVCPMVTPGVPPIPHVGGIILPPGRPNVLIGGLPAATVTNLCMCVGPPDVIIQGSIGVLVGGMPLARLSDSTAHGGKIVMGCFTVLIGDIGTPSPSGMMPDVDMGALADMATAAASAVADAASATAEAMADLPEAIDSKQAEIQELINNNASPEDIATAQEELAALQGI